MGACTKFKTQEYISEEQVLMILQKELNLPADNFELNFPLNGDDYSIVSIKNADVERDIRRLNIFHNMDNFVTILDLGQNNFAMELLRKFGKYFPGEYLASDYSEEVEFLIPENDKLSPELKGSIEIDLMRFCAKMPANMTSAEVYKYLLKEGNNLYNLLDKKYYSVKHYK